MVITATARKWGDSLGVVIPKEFALDEGITEGDTLFLQIEKEADLTPFFGTCKREGESSQKLKDELREIWGR